MTNVSTAALEKEEAPEKPTWWQITAASVTENRASAQICPQSDM